MSVAWSITKRRTSCAIKQRHSLDFVPENFSMKVKALQDYVAKNLKKAVVDTGDLDDY